MKQVRLLAQYYVDLMVKLGLVRFSILLASCLVLLAVLAQVAVTVVLQGRVQGIDLVRSIFFGLLITPWAVYYLSVVVDQLEESRQRLSKLVDKLEDMRAHDTQLKQQMQQTIIQLNHEIADRVNAEKAREQMVAKLKEEMARRGQAQIELEQKSSFLRSFLDASPDLVFYRNTEKEFSGCNRAMELLLGKNEKALIGTKPADIFEPEAAIKAHETDERVFRHNVSLTFEQWFNYPDGRRACFEIRKVPYYDHTGKLSGLMGFGRDITERKRYQDALESASRDKTTFISIISHELRTPLNGIVGLSRILLDTQLDTEQLNYLKTIYVSAITLGNIFNDVIEVDKIERRKVELDIQPIDFTEFLAELENLSGLLVSQKALKFRLAPQDLLPHQISTDGTRLRQILWNLISNAIKFTASGEVVVTVTYTHGEILRFEVIDSGIGIPQEELDKIFVMYYQVTSCHGGRPATGTGIGLAVSRRLAQAMGGDITVRSTPGKGSCFTLQIRAPSVAEEVEDVEGNDDLPLPALHVLLVEDIDLNVVVARSVLEKLGCTVDVAMTGKQAIEMFDPTEFDLVLLDIQLPDLTGLDVASSIRQRYSACTLPPLIALTANVLKDKRAYMEAGMDDVLSKPLSVPALIQMIKKFWNGYEKLNLNEHPESQWQQRFAKKLDIDMLIQYKNLVGIKLIEEGVVLFENMLPDYIQVLDEAIKEENSVEASAIGHKIKGAASTLGLLSLQYLAKQIQDSETKTWQQTVVGWAADIRDTWRGDIALLREWIELAVKNDPD